MSESTPGEGAETEAERLLRERLALEHDRWRESLSEAEWQKLHAHQEAARQKIADEQAFKARVEREAAAGRARADQLAADYLERAVVALGAAGFPESIAVQLHADDVPVEEASGWLVGTDEGRDLLVTTGGQVVLLEPARRSLLRKQRRTGRPVVSAKGHLLPNCACGLQAIAQRHGVAVDGPGPT